MGKVSLRYLTSGHTHSGIDATLGQLASKLSHEELEDDLEVVDLPSNCMAELGIDTHCRENDRCHKLDEAEEWTAWIEQHGVHFSLVALMRRIISELV